MPTRRQPRCGSMQYWPRKRSKKVYARIRNVPDSKDCAPLAFLGYKVGMTHVQVTEKRQKKSEVVTVPVTLLECPPMKVAGIRYYTNNVQGSRCVGEVWHKPEKELKRRIIASKKKESEKPKSYDEIRLLVHAQPSLTGIGKKKPELFEVNVGGDLETAEKFAEEAKEILVESVFKEGEFVDVMGISKGKGFQGTTKRFGTTLKRRKSEKGQRGAANVGAWTPHKVLFVQPMPGKMGYHQRTEYNKQIMQINNAPEEVNPAGGFVKYGLVRNTCVLVRGSVVGSKKRPIIMRKPTRSKKQAKAVSIEYINKSSQQGR